MYESDFAEAAADNWSKLRDDVDLSRFVVGMRIMRLSAVLRSTLDEALAASGFAVLGDYEVMATLRRAGGRMLPSDIADDLRMTRAGITGRLDRLERRGFVERERSGDDLRNVVVKITTKGRRATDRAFDQVLACEAEMFASLSDRDVADLARLLRQVAIEHDPAVAHH